MNGAVDLSDPFIRLIVSRGPSKDIASLCYLSRAKVEVGVGVSRKYLVPLMLRAPRFASWHLICCVAGRYPASVHFSRADQSECCCLPRGVIGAVIVSESPSMYRLFLLHENHPTPTNIVPK